MDQIAGGIFDFQLYSELEKESNLLTEANNNFFVCIIPLIYCCIQLLGLLYQMKICSTKLSCLRYRKININGTLKNSAGVRSFQVVMSSDKRFRLMGWATVIPNRPLMVLFIINYITMITLTLNSFTPPIMINYQQIIVDNYQQK